MSRYRWLKLHHDIIADIKLRRFSPAEKWAWVVILCLASQSTKRGIVTADPEDVAEACEFNNFQDWLYFRDKLVAKGMVELTSDGLLVCNFAERQYDNPSDAPDETRERKARQRAREKAAQAQAEKAGVTSSHEQSRGCHEDVTTQIRGEENRSEEKREEKNLEPPNPPAGGGHEAQKKAEPATAKRSKPRPDSADGIELPESLESPQLRQALGEWLEHKRQIRDPLRELGIAKLIKRLAVLGIERSVAAIDYSIANGWKGVFEEKNSAVAPKFGKVAQFKSAEEKRREQLEAWARGEPLQHEEPFIDVEANHA